MPAPFTLHNMTFAADLATGAFPLALEITPPRAAKPEVLLRRARLLGDAPTAINVIQRIDRQSSLEACEELLAAGLEPVWHLLARGTTRKSLGESLRQANAAGIANVLCILGDRPTGGSSVKVRDLVTACVAAMPAALVGATFNQHGPNRDQALRNLFGKLEAGATFVETQPVFTPGGLDWFATTLEREFPAVHRVAMVMPIATPHALARMEQRLGITVPAAYARRIARGAEEAWAAFDEVLDDLRGAGKVAGVAVMTPEMDPPPETAARLCTALERTGIGRRTAPAHGEATLP